MTDPDAETDIVSRRWFSHPAATLFAAFANPDDLAEWWGPAGFSNQFTVFELRPGGAWRFIMKAPDGTLYENHSVFAEIAVPTRIVFDHLEPGHPFRMVMQFVETDEKTELVWTMSSVQHAGNPAFRSFLMAANEQNFDRLAACLAASAPGGDRV